MADRRSGPFVMMTVEPPGGTWPHIDTLARELALLGAEVAVAALAPLRPGQRIEYAGIPGVELLVCPVAAASAADHLAGRDRIAAWLLSMEEMLNPDVVHLTGYLHAGLPWCGKLLVAGHPGSGSAYGRLSAESRRVCRSAFQHGLRAADLVVTPSDTMLAALSRHFGAINGRVIRDGRDPARFTPGSKEPVILSASTIRDDPARVSALERAAPRLPWPVVVAGEQCDEAGKPLRLDGVSVLGRLHPNQVSPWLNRAAVYAANSAEGPGTWLPEAALSGCALVLGDTAALRELWSGAALFVPQDDPDALAAGLRTLAADRRLREAMGFAARRRALRHTAKGMAESYLAAYRGLIAARARDQFAQENRYPA